MTQQDLFLENRIKDKSYKITSNDAGKAFDKI